MRARQKAAHLTQTGQIHLRSFRVMTLAEAEAIANNSANYDKETLRRALAVLARERIRVEQDIRSLNLQE